MKCGAETAPGWPPKNEGPVKAVKFLGQPSLTNPGALSSFAPGPGILFDKLCQFCACDRDYDSNHTNSYWTFISAV